MDDHLSGPGPDIVNSGEQANGVSKQVGRVSEQAAGGSHDLLGVGPLQGCGVEQIGVGGSDGGSEAIQLQHGRCHPAVYVRPHQAGVRSGSGQDGDLWVAVNDITYFIESIFWEKWLMNILLNRYFGKNS